MSVYVLYGALLTSNLPGTHTDVSLLVPEVFISADKCLLVLQANSNRPGFVGYCAKRKIQK